MAKLGLTLDTPQLEYGPLGGLKTPYFRKICFFPTKPRVPHAGPDQSVLATTAGIAKVILDGSSSDDPYEDDLTYRWTWRIPGRGYSAEGMSPTVKLPIGQHTIELIVSDGIEDSEPDTTTVEIEMGQCIDDLAVR